MPLRSLCSIIPQRWVVCALCSSALAIITIKNTCFYAVADIIASVTDERTIPPEDTGCPFYFTLSPGGQRDMPFHLPDVYWNEYIIGIADAVFHTGRFLAIIPAGVLADLGYSKSALGWGMVLVAASHLSRAACVDCGVTAKLVENLVEGVGEAAILPSIVSLIARWTPPWERNTFAALVVAGMVYGNTLGHAIFHLVYIGASSWGLGHSFIGTLALLWSLLCYIFIYHSPDESPLISQHEFRTISNIHRRSSLVASLVKLHMIPWRQIVTSLPFLSLVSVFCSLRWLALVNIEGNLKGYQIFVLRLPEKFSDRSSAVMVVSLPMVLVGGFLADWIIKRDLLSKITVKRLFTSVSVFCSSVLIVLSCLVGCNVPLFWGLSVSFYYFLGLCFPVIYCAPVDLSPRHAGLLMGIMKGVMTMSSVFDERIQQRLVPDVYNRDQWLIRCILLAILTSIMTIPYLVFGSAEKQHWKSLRFSPQEFSHSQPQVAGQSNANRTSE